MPQNNEIYCSSYVEHYLNGHTIGLYSQTQKLHVSIIDSECNRARSNQKKNILQKNDKRQQR